MAAVLAPEASEISRHCDCLPQLTNLAALVLWKGCNVARSPWPGKPGNRLDRGCNNSLNRLKFNGLWPHMIGRSFHRGSPLTSHFQNGAILSPRPKPSRAAFILDWIARAGSYRGDLRTGPDYRVALRLAAQDPMLEIVDDPSVVNGAVLPGWKVRRRKSPPG
jgi:hypothetical protein